MNERAFLGLVLLSAAAYGQRLSFEQQLPIARGAFFPQVVRHAEELDAGVYRDTSEGSWKLLIVNHIADSFTESVYTWNDTVRAFCYGGETSLVELVGPIRPDCSSIVYFQRKHMSDGRVRDRMIFRDARGETIYERR